MAQNVQKICKDPRYRNRWCRFVVKSLTLVNKEISVNFPKESWKKIHQISTIIKKFSTKFPRKTKIHFEPPAPPNPPIVLLWSRLKVLNYNKLWKCRGVSQAHQTSGTANGSWLVVSSPTDQAQLHWRDISMVIIDTCLLHVTGSDRKWILLNQGHGSSASLSYDWTISGNAHKISIVSHKV